MATSNPKKSAAKKTDNKKKVSHANKMQTGQPEKQTEITDNSDYEPEEEIQSEQPQEATEAEPSVADIVKKNKDS